MRKFDMTSVVQSTARRAGRRIALLACAAGLTIGSAVAAHATQLYLNFPGVVGDSVDSHHAREVVLTGFSATDTLNLAANNTGRAAGRPTCGQVTVTKLIDRASPQLLALLFTGRTTQGPVVISFENVTESGAVDYYQVALNNVVVDNISQSDSTSDVVKETVQLRATQFVWTFKAQTGDGSVTPVKFGWDCATNRQL